MMGISRRKKYELIFALLSLLLGACKSRPPFTDNGNPGQIKVIAFYDDNQNGKLDSQKLGVSARVGISQAISCPADSYDKYAQTDTDASGVATFRDLKPGCIVSARWTIMA
jgi:hypothetical protein